MAKFPVNTHRTDPYRNFKFRVRWDGKQIPGISRVSPLRRSTEVVAHRDGGDISSVRHSPGVTTYEPITLERGITHDTSFEDWANLTFSIQGDAAVSLKNYRKDIQIDLLNLQGVVVRSFAVYRCWVSDYLPLPELVADQAVIAVERIVLQHEGWERDSAVTEPTET